MTRKIICGDAIVISCGLTNMNGYRLKVSCTPEGHFVANSKLIEHDMVADNGIVHAIDTVLLPDAGLYMKQGMETSENRHFEWCRFIFFFLFLALFFVLFFGCCLTFRTILWQEHHEFFLEAHYFCRIYHHIILFFSIFFNCVLKRNFRNTDLIRKFSLDFPFFYSFKILFLTSDGCSFLFNIEGVFAFLKAVLN